MALYMVGIGLWDAKDISVRGLETVKRCTKVYLEIYTSRLGSSIAELESLYGKHVIAADRSMVENKGDEIINEAKSSDVAFLVIGDVLSATTHLDLWARAREAGVHTEIMHNASIITAVAETGLELYKFGRVVSIPFENEKVASPVDFYRRNEEQGLHTLFLLDLRPDENRFMKAADAARYLLRHIPDRMAIGCAGIGSPKPEMRYALLSVLSMHDFSLYPQSLILPANLHFMEEEALRWYS
jgi:diphthine synthase